jgi:hypothetical protein
MAAHIYPTHIPPNESARTRVRVRACATIADYATNAGYATAATADHATASTASS